MTFIVTSAVISPLILLSEALQTVLSGADGGDGCVLPNGSSPLSDKLQFTKIPNIEIFKKT